MTSNEVPKCRDCADFGPICPSTGNPCGTERVPAQATPTAQGAHINEQQEREAWETWVSKRSEHLRTHHNENIYRAGYSAGLAAKSVPDGWKLAPVDPTELILKRFTEEINARFAAALAQAVKDSLTAGPAQAQQAEPSGPTRPWGAVKDMLGATPAQAQQAAVDHSMCPHQHSVDDWRLHRSGGPKP